jgi:hypothetical protein
MTSPKSDLPQGALDLLILKALSLAQLDAELRDHLERLAADYVRAGAGVPDARPCRRSDARPCAIAGPWSLAPVPA